MENGKSTFRPHICSNGSIPTLCFKPRHYLGRLRSYCFQVSSTEDGSTDLGSSAKTLTNDLAYANALPSELKPLIAFSHICEAGVPFDEFWDLLADDPKLVNSFITVTDDMCGIYCSGFDISGIESMIHTIEKEEVEAFVDNPRIFVASKPFVCTVQNGNAYVPLGVLILCRDSIHIQDSESGLAYGISFPDYRCIEGNINTDENEYYELLWNRLTWVLFCYAGIVLETTGLWIRHECNNIETTQKTSEIANKHDFFNFIQDTLAII